MVQERRAPGWTLLQAAVLVVLAVVAHAPALSAGFIWDDDHYVTDNPVLRSLEGLRLIWTRPSATQWWARQRPRTRRQWSGRRSPHRDDAA